MARMEWKGDVQMQAALGNAESKLPSIIPDMLQAAGAILLAKLQGANATFRKYWNAKKPKKNKYGWFVSVALKGKTRNGTPAALAAGVYEYGRANYHPQPARPFVRSAIKAAEGEAEKAMQEVFERGLKEAGL